MTDAARNGFYWLQSLGTSGWTIGQLTNGWWDLIGSLHTLDHKDIANHFRVGGFIGDTEGFHPDLAMRAVLDPGQFTTGYGSERADMGEWQREALSNAFTPPVHVQPVANEEE